MKKYATYKSFLLILSLMLFHSFKSQTFNSSGSTAFTNNGPEVCNSVAVSGLATSINSTFGVTQVCATLSSDCMKDVDMFLVAPDGTRIDLSTDNGGNSDGFNNLCFRMDASVNGSIANIPRNNGTIHTGNWIPEGNLYDANNNQNPNGTWRICIRDDKGGGGCTTNGTLTSWSINFGAPPPRAISVQDCNGAIPVCQTTYSETNTYPGTGYNSNEVSVSGNCLADNEKNSVWYVFTVETSGNLGFQITPKSGDPLFDYDFAMYNITTNGCSGITGDPADGDPVSPQVSCSFSTAGGPTGTSAAGVGNNNGALAGNQNTLLAVTAGQTYAFQVSNFTGGGNGYDLNFNAPGNTASIVDVTPPTYGSIVGTVTCGSNVVTFTTSEPVRCTSLNGNEYSVTGPSYSSSGTSVGSSCPGMTSSITLTLATPLPTTSNGPFILTVANGGDGNTVQDNCGNRQPVAQTISFTTSCVLPVNYMDFKAQNINNEHVVVNWITQNEEKNDYFTVEKSVDGISFYDIARKESNKSNDVYKKYEVLDYDLLQNVTYYRLKQTDYDGKSSNHGPILVDYVTPVKVLVNSNESTITVFYDSKLRAETVLFLSDIYGKIIYKENVNKSNFESKINMQNFSSGVYFVRFENQDIKLNYKIFY